MGLDEAVELDRLCDHFPACFSVVYIEAKGRDNAECLNVQGCVINVKIYNSRLELDLRETSAVDTDR